MPAPVAALQCLLWFKVTAVAREHRCSKAACCTVGANMGKWFCGCDALFVEPAERLHKAWIAANCRSIFGHGTVWWLSDKLRSRLTTEEWVCLAKRAPSQAAIDVQWGAGMDAWVLHSSSALGSRACEQAVFDIWHVVAEGR